MMTKESGTTAISDPDRPVEPASPVTAATPSPVPAPGAIVLALLSLGWLAAMLRSAEAEISFSSIDSMVIASAAYALPGVISASLVSGAAVSITVVNLLTRFGVRRTTPRFAAALAAGLVTGLLAALAVTLSYGEGPAIMVLAGSTAAAATVGGIAGGLRSTLVVAAIVAAGLAVFAVGFALSYFKDPVLSFYGASTTDLERYRTAMELFSWTGSLASGLAAGLLAFGYLRVAGRRVAARFDHATPPRWPAYMIAGAGAGLLLLTAEAITRTAGAEVLRMASAISEIDQAGQGTLGESRFSHGLLVLFLSAFVATIAFGRTLRPATESATGAPGHPDHDHGGAADHPDGLDDADDADDRVTDDDPEHEDDGADRVEPDDDHEPADRPEPVAGAGR